MTEPGEISSLVRPELIFSDISGDDRRSVLRSISEGLVGAADIGSTADELFERLLEREELGSTSVGPLVAIPHCKLKGLHEVVVSVAVCRRPIDFGSDDDGPVQLFFTVISPEDDPAGHLQSLAMISRWIKENSHVEDLVELEDREAILAFLSGEEQQR